MFVIVNNVIQHARVIICNRQRKFTSQDSGDTTPVRVAPGQTLYAENSGERRSLRVGGDTGLDREDGGCYNVTNDNWRSGNASHTN